MKYPNRKKRNCLLVETSPVTFFSYPKKDFVDFVAWYISNYGASEMTKEEEYWYQRGITLMNREH